jgi:glucose/mannose-6-phosphate isomerase
MFDLIKNFPGQMQQALEIGESADIKNTFTGGINNILVCGLGGSGIGGNLLAELLRDSLSIPVLVNKGYSLPAFANQSTLIILSSYSGNTEETITVGKQAIAKGLKPVCVTSGGQLAEMATEHDLCMIKIPGGFPPRACLGFSATQLFFVLHKHGLIDGSFKELLSNTAKFLQSNQASIMSDAEALAKYLHHKLIILYADDKYESTVLRFKQQINENSKLQAWYNVVPEMNHNELVGWRENHENLAAILLRASDENSRNTLRILFSKDVMENLSGNIHEITAHGSNTYEKHFYLIHFGDWVTYYLAVQQGYDPMEINVLNTLKAHMQASL